MVCGVLESHGMALQATYHRNLGVYPYHEHVLKLFIFVGGGVAKAVCVGSLARALATINWSAVSAVWSAVCPQKTIQLLIIFESHHPFFHNMSPIFPIILMSLVIGMMGLPLWFVPRKKECKAHFERLALWFYIQKLPRPRIFFFWTSRRKHHLTLKTNSNCEYFRSCPAPKPMISLESNDLFGVMPSLKKKPLFNLHELWTSGQV